MMRIASKSVMGLESSNGFERNKATLLGWPIGACLGFSRDFLRILPSRVAVFTAFKKDPKNQLLAFSHQLSAFSVSEPPRRFPANMKHHFASAVSSTSMKLKAECDT
jgi:hypothetical protein